MNKSIKLVCLLTTLTAFASTEVLAAGKCFNLMVIGVKKGKKPQMDNSEGHRIFVIADGKTSIYLKEGPMDVIDGNGTDANGATLQLPNPATSTYEVYAKLVGKPKTGMDITTCVTVDGGTAAGTYCSSNILSMKRIAGTPKTLNVSKQLLSAEVTGDFNGDGVLETITVPLFADFTDGAESYFWEVDAFGQAKAQLRFCSL